MESNIETKEEAPLNLEEKKSIINLDKFNQTKEEDVGITEYMSPENPGFKCVLKHRYSDFLVNEIGLDGKVVWIKESDTTPQNQEKKMRKKKRN